VREAITEAFAELDSERPRRAAELERIEAELRRTDEALGRYFAAFEAGTLADRDCGRRTADLSRRLGGREAQREELAVDAEDEPEPSPRRSCGHCKPTSERSSKPATRHRGRRCSKRSSKRSASSAAPRSTPASLCPRFDERQGQRARQDSNLRPSVP
jgi:hypothetical protein